MKVLILFLLKASDEWGLGHVFRSIHLWEEIKRIWREKYRDLPFPEAKFLLTEPYAKAEDMLLSVGITPWRGEKVNLVVSDNGLAYGELQKRYTLDGIPSVVLDGEGGDLVFRWGDYLPVRRIFLERKAAIRKDISKVLLSFGGTDPSRFSLKFLRAIFTEGVKQIFLARGVEKVVFFVKDEGIVRKMLDFLLLRREELPGFDIVVDASTEEIPFYDFDFAFLSAGLTMLEACTVGLPFIALAHNDRQVANIKRLVSSVCEATSIPENFLLEKIFADTVGSSLEKFSKITKDERRIISTALRNWALSRKNLSEIADTVLNMAFKLKLK